MPANPFSTDVAARLYAAGRPNYSSIATDVIRRLIGTERVGRAADIGCGTGVSTRVLAPLADSVIGVDESPTMLAYAEPVANVTYLLGSAEHLPIEDATCDLIGVGSALHWFDQSRFLAEASRVAAPDAWLVVFDHWFAGQMLGQPGFSDWSRDVYLEAYPSAPRDRSWRPPEDLGSWRHAAWERYDQSVAMTVDQLATYLLTQSNLQVVIERGEETEEELRSWLHRETTPFFDDDRAATFMFGGFAASHRADTE